MSKNARFLYRALLFLLAVPFFYAFYTVTFAQLSSGDAPLISNVKITDIGEDKATITWTTDKEADSAVNYGMNEDHGIRRRGALEMDHSITVDLLEPATTYHFRVMSIDGKGNRSASGGFTWKTAGLEDVEGLEDVRSEEERALVERILAMVRRLESLEAIRLVAGEAEDTAGDVGTPPSIIGVPKVAAEMETAEIVWRTDRRSNSLVHFVTEDEYREGSADPYTFTQGDHDELTTDHRVKIIGLLPATTYHFKVSSEDDVGLRGESVDAIFETKSPLPVIRNVRVQKAQETSVTVAWTTDYPADGLIEYQSTRTGAAKSAGDPTFATSHSVQITELEFGTRYSAVIRSKNEAGDEAVSDPFTFATVKDEAPPVISKVKNESTLFPGGETKIQTLVGWETDEAAACQLFYHQGLVKGDEGRVESLPKEEVYTAAHTKVIVGFSPSTVYRFWMECSDRAENEARSEDFVLFTPAQEKNIIDVILENFEGTFGWVKNITG